MSRSLYGFLALGALAIVLTDSDTELAPGARTARKRLEEVWTAEAAGAGWLRERRKPGATLEPLEVELSDSAR